MLHTLAQIVACLHRHARRATYGSLTLALGYDPGAAQAVGNLLASLPRDHLHSWVVAKGTKRPSGYASHQIDPRLPSSGTPITDPTVLLDFLRTHGP